MWALNEVEGMVVKAARGAGIPLGHAQDLGRVASYLAATGSSTTPITDALQEQVMPADVRWDEKEITVLSGSAACVGPVVRDAFEMGLVRATLSDTAHAPLVGGFLAMGGIAQKWDRGLVTLSDTTVLKPKCQPVTIPEKDWQIWGAFAARTYVPETEASRLAGAGAGLTDND